MQQRYLFFDSGCAVCTRLADDIAHASDGWLTARSLRDPAVQTLLDAARPGWRWEPTLLEVRDGRPHVFTGVAMRARMALGLGPRRTLNILRIVERVGVPLSQIGRVQSPARRSFLKQAFLGLAVLPLFKRAPEKPPTPGVSPPGASDVVMRDVTGSEAQRLLQQAQANSSVQALQQHLLRRGYNPIYTQASVRSISWSDSSGSHDAFWVTLPHEKGNKEALGFIQYSITVGKEDAITAQTLSNSNAGPAFKLYQLENGKVKEQQGPTLREAAIRVSSESATIETSHNSATAAAAGYECTTSCVINCIWTTYGCNPITVVGCIAACVACPASGLSCFGCGICLGWCNGAVAYCTKLCCGI